MIPSFATKQLTPLYHECCRLVQSPGLGRNPDVISQGLTMNSAMVRFLSSLLLAAAGVRAGEATYELAGRIQPEGQASVTLFGAASPFTASALADDSGRFTFKKLQAGEYTVSVF